jgi:Na+/proline symporter
MEPRRLGVGDTQNIGGSGALLVLYGPAVAGTVLGALIWQKHRIYGGLLGLAAGIATTMATTAVVQARSTALSNAPPVAVTTLRNSGYPVTLTSTTGGDVIAQATAAGFHVDGTQPHGAGPITAVWEGANGAPVPAGLKAMQSAAMAQAQSTI